MTRTRMLSTLLVAIPVAIGCGSGRPQDAAAKPDTAAPTAPAQPPPQGGPAGTATIQGSVSFTGTAPARTPVQMAADPVCQQQHAEPVLTEDVLPNPNGTLRNVVIYITDGVQGAYPAPATPVTLDQRGCWYQPHVFGIQVGQPLEIVNSDSTLHNINAKPQANQAFNIAQPVKGMKTTKRFAKPEVGVRFKCNVHPWMRASAVVVAHPFFSVTGEDGSFRLANLPAGTYTLAAWHETLGAQTQQVTVADGEMKSVTFAFR